MRPSDEPTPGDRPAANDAGSRRFSELLNGRPDGGAEDLARSLAPAFDALAAAVKPVVRPAQALVKRVAPPLLKFVAVSKYLASQVDFPNWTELETEAEWRKALDLMCRDDGVPLVWCPPAGVVKALVEAPDHEARDAVLVRDAAAIVSQAEQVLGEVTHHDLATLRDALSQGWTAYRSELTIPAQTTAATAIGDLIRRNGHRQFSGFRKAWEPTRDAGLLSDFGELRRAAVMLTLHTAVLHEGINPRIWGFNRNAASHEFRAEQFSEANALRGLMAATSGLRELQFELAGEWASRPAGSIPAVRLGVIREAEARGAEGPVVGD